MNYSYILQRIVFAIGVLVGVTLLTFWIIKSVPGDPARIKLGVTASDEAVAAQRERMGLNRPFFVQYTSWVGNALQGDFGKSLKTDQPVAPQLTKAIPATLQLAFGALMIGMLISFPLGILSATRNGTKTDVFISLLSQIGVSIPDFWLGILLVLLFSLRWDTLPPSGHTPITEDFVDWLEHLILPALTAGLISASIQTRFIRSAMLEVLDENYIRTARAKGLRERVVLLRHALRPAMINIVTIIGLQITALLSSVVVIEILFSWPGLGRLSLNAVLDRDYPLLLGSVLTLAFMVTVINLLIDLAYFLIDPRIEYA
jgi:peptide/nickel transport system permease protein